MKWSVREDELVVSFYRRHPSDWNDHFDELVRKFRAEGFCRAEGSIRMRVQNVVYLATGGGLEHAAQQTIDVFRRIG